MKIAVMGDVVPGGILHYQKGFCLENNLKKYLSTFDYRIATLESPIGNPININKNKKNIIYSLDKSIKRLKELDINCVSLANNHIFDLSIEGFKNTIKLLKQNNILFCGAGINLSEARQPAIFNLNGLKIGILAYCQSSRYLRFVSEATDTAPGVALLKLDYMLEDIKLAKQNCDYIYCLLHWGIEYTWLISPEIQSISKELILAGADGIFGSHSHRVQPYYKINSKPVYFSLGNFLFPNFILKPPVTIDYPKSITMSSLNKCRIIYIYKEVNQITIRIWKYLSRIGMISEISLNGSQKKCRTIFTIAHKFNSKIQLYSNLKSKLLKIWLILVSYGVRLPFYNFIFYKILKLS